MTSQHASHLPVLGENPDVPGLGRRIVVWVAATTVGLFLLVAGAVWWVTGDLTNAILGGLFTTLWGGPGFGIMFGAAYQAIKEDDAEKAALAATATD